MAKTFDERKKCWFCGSTQNLQLHHIYNGVAFRKISDGFEYKGTKYKATCYLCLNHHTGQEGVHSHPDKLRELKKECQLWLENNNMSRDDFIRVFGRNYVDN